MTDIKPILCDDPNIPIDDDRNRRIHVAAAHGDKDSVMKEIEKGAKVDVENYLGWTPLMMAVRNGHSEVVTFLLEHKADATKKNKFGISVFHLSIANGNEELILMILTFLLEGGVSRLSMESVLSPLALATLFHKNEIVRMLICKFFSVNVQTPRTALTPLMFAAATNNMAAYQLLLSSGANANLKNINQQTANDIIQMKQLPQPPSPYPQPAAAAAIETPTVAVLEPRPKKSSNVVSPSTFFVSPHLSPVTPFACHHQVFFPPEFSCDPNRLSQIVNICRSPAEIYYQIAQPVSSPFAPQYAFFAPCLNDRISPHHNVSYSM